jgi:hypothetical protein
MNPYEDKSFKFFLKFNNDDRFGTIEVTETVKFDGATYIVEQDSKRYGRDVSFMNENLDLIFYKGTYDVSENPLLLPDGTIVNNLTQGFEYLIEYLNIYGSESDVDYIVEKDSIVSNMGSVEITKTDGEYFVKAKVEQSGIIKIAKDRDDIVVNMFSSEDLDGNPITPLTTTNILIKSKPITQNSEWSLPNVLTYNLGGANIGNFTSYYNFINNSVLYGVEDSLNYIQGAGAVSNFVYIQAVEDLTNVSIDLDLDLTLSREGDTGASQFGSISMWYAILETPPIDTIGSNSIFEQSFNTANNNVSYTVNETFTINNLNIPSGYRLYIYFRTQVSIISFFRLKTQFNSCVIKIKASSTSIDKVSKGFRYVDAKKHIVKSISGLDVYAPKFDIGGKYYSQFLMSGNMLRGRVNVPFSIKFKDIMETIREVNADYQLDALDSNGDIVVYIGQFLDFYPNKEIGVFPIYPDESSVISFNERFKVNSINLEYKHFEQNKDAQNTLDATHTKSQWLTPNKKSVNDININLPQVRDAYKFQFTIDQPITNTNSIEADDLMFLLDVVPLAPSTRGGFTRSLKHNINSDGRLQMLNDNSFSWLNLGFNIGSEFIIENTSNAGTYTVYDVTNSIITLTGSPSFNSTGILTTVNYPLENVLYVNRTNEGFELIENLLNDTDFSNLLYTQKRNLKEWYNNFATICKSYPNGVLRNTEFLNNGDLITRFTGETENTEEKANINVSDFGEGRLTPNLIKVKLVADWGNTVAMLTALKTINDDGTIGGFVRGFDNSGKVVKGYPKKLEYEPATETLTVTLEVRNEGDYLQITSGVGEITVNEVGYPIDVLNDQWYEFNNDYLIIYDINSNPIINKTRYDFVKIDGVLYDSAILLSQRLIEIT